MPKDLIERTVPSAGAMSADDLRQLSGHSKEVLRALGPDIQWVHNYVRGDKIYCLYNARDPEIIREHARCGGFPADLVTPVATIIDPITAEA